MEKRMAVATRGFVSLQSLLASASLLAWVSVAHAGSLEDTVRTALQTNPEVGVVKADRLAVDQELRLARSQYLPALDLRAAAGPEYTNSVSTRRRSTRPADGDGHTTLFRSEAQLRLSQMLFDGFATDSEVARQRSRVDSAAYRVHEAAEFVGLDAVEAHLDILRNEEIVALNERNIEQHNRILQQVRELEQSGRGDIADLRQTEARLARAQETLAVARGNLADAVASYQRIVGERPTDLDHDKAPLGAIPPTQEDAASVASVNSPTVMIAAADVDVAAAELRASRSGFYPRFDLELGTTAGENLDGTKGGNVDASALVVMRYNIFRGGGDMALEREAFHRANEARSRLQRARRGAEEEARMSYNALETARARTVALTNQTEAQRRTRDAYASQFEIGQRDLLDVLDAENELFLDRVSLVTAQYTEEFAVYRVLAVVGELLNTFDIARPRENVSIERGVSDEQTPEAIERKSKELSDPKAEPRPLRSEEAGEAPADAPDSAPFVGSPKPLGSDDPGAVGAGSVDGVPASKVDVESRLETPATNPATRSTDIASLPIVDAPALVEKEPLPETAVAVQSSDDPSSDYDSYPSFFSSVFGSDAAEEGAKPVVVTATVSDPQPLTEADGAAPAPETGAAMVMSKGAGQPASYDSFGSLFSNLFGGGVK
ncbi:MAG: TolC family outer membrane protein [Geminicoccaceae bacterium]|nr:TolC family outer membrane protein [Geminicoccaceae bacterium]